MRIAILACGMLALVTVTANAQDDGYTPHDRGVGEWIGFDNYRVAPRYENNGRAAGFLHFDNKSTEHGVYYRPFHSSLSKGARCAPEPWRPLGMGNLWNRTCATKRMDYLPYRLRDTRTDYGPAYYRVREDKDCTDCEDCRLRLKHGLGCCQSCKSSGCNSSGCNSCEKKTSCLSCKSCKGCKSGCKSCQSCLSPSAKPAACSSCTTSTQKPATNLVKQEKQVRALPVRNTRTRVPVTNAVRVQQTVIDNSRYVPNLQTDAGNEKP